MQRKEVDILIQRFGLPVQAADLRIRIHADIYAVFAERLSLCRSVHCFKRKEREKAHYDRHNDNEYLLEDICGGIEPFFPVRTEYAEDISETEQPAVALCRAPRKCRRIRLRGALPAFLRTILRTAEHKPPFTCTV